MTLSKCGRQKRKTGRSPSSAKCCKLLEVDFACELEEAAFVVDSAGDSALGGVDLRVVAAVVICVKLASLDVQIVMVEEVVSFSTQLDIELLVDREALRGRHVDVVGSRSAECIAGGHGGRIRTKVRDAQQRRIAEGFVERQCVCSSQSVEVRVAGRTARDGLEQVLPDRGDGVVARNAVTRVVVCGVVEGERRTGACSEDTGEFVASEEFAKEGGLVGEVGRTPDRREHEAIVNVEVAVAVIETGVEGVGVAQGKVAGRGLRERGAEVVERMGKGVVSNQRQAGVMDVLRRELNVERVVVRVAVRATVVVVRVLGVEAGQTGVSRDGILDGIAEVEVAAARDVVVLDVVEVSTTSTVVGEFQNDTASQLLIDSERVELGLRSANVLVYVT